MNATNIQPYSKAVVKLLKGIVEKDDVVWDIVLDYQNEIQDYISLIGLELIVKRDDGFAFFKQMKLDDDKTLNLVSRRSYGFEVSVILIVLRQILEDFDSNPTESQAEDKYVSATEIKEEAELFLPMTFNRAKFEKDLDRYIDSIVGFGFLVEAKHAEGEKRYKIHRIIKEKVTLDDLIEFKNTLTSYDTSDKPL